MSALSSYLDRKAGFEQWFIKAREGHSGLGWLKISYCNCSVKRRPPRPRPEYTNEIKKNRNKFVPSEHSLSNLEVICLICDTIILVTSDSIFEENEGKILLSSC